MRIALLYKNFAAHKHVSHIGLGVAALNNQKVLRREGITADVVPIAVEADLEPIAASGKYSHISISAPWISTAALQRTAARHPDTMFSVVCHSNVGFLQADSHGIRLLREGIELERGTHNFHLAGNSRAFARWIHNAFGVPCAYLPNAYYLDSFAARPRPLYSGGILRIGAFGATRPLKNFMSAAGAALEIAHALKADLELWVSAGRTEGGGDTILRAAREMYRNLPNARLVENGWQSWPAFRGTVANMHLLMQPSYTESFNMVTADGIAAGVPSVISDAIEWAPDYWQACSDDTHAIARTGRQLLHDPQAAADGLESLQNHNADAVGAWRRYLAA